jgi:hypothetical protein
MDRLEFEPRSEPLGEAELEPSILKAIALEGQGIQKYGNKW